MNRFAPGFLDPLSANPLERVLARLLGWLSWAVLALIGLVFMLSLLAWLLVMAVVSLVSGWITGRPSTVSQLWTTYRQMAGQRWPRRAGDAPAERAGTAGPQAGSRPRAQEVQDVSWRDLPAGGDQTSDP